MTRSLLTFEWTYHFRQVSTLAFAGAFLLLGFAFGGLGAVGEAHLHRDGAWAITYATGILGLGSVFLVMVLAAHAVLRDVTDRMAPIVHATPIPERRFLAARFAGLWSTSVLVFSPAFLGYWIGTRMPWIDPDQLGTSGVAFHLWPWLVLALPNLLLVSSLLFALAAATRSRPATYVGGLLIYALYMACSVYFDSPLMAGSEPASAEGLTLAALLDPFGLAAFLEQSRTWTLEERNLRLVGLHGSFLANRLLWLGVSGVLLGWIARFFSFRELARPDRRILRRPRLRRRAATAVAPSSGPPSRSSVPVAPASPGPSPGLNPGPWAVARSLGARTRLELALLLRSRAFWLLLLIWIFIAAMELVPRIFGGGEYGADLYPTTPLLVSWLESPLLVVGALALVFYGGEIAASDRDAGMEPLVGATPVPPGVRLAAKLLALASLPLLLIGVGIAVGVGCQLAASYHRFDWLVYLGLFHFQGVRLLLLAALALSIPVLTGRKSLGMVLTLGAFLASSGLGAMAGLRHPLLRFAAAPEVLFTDMDGFGATAPFHWLMLYWSAVAVLVLCLARAVWASRVWPRAGVGGLRQRLRALPAHWDRPGLTVAAGALLLAVGTGGFVFYQTNVVRPYRTESDELDRRAAYERHYKRYENMPEPTVVALDTRLDLFPSERRYRMENRLVLENEQERPIDAIFFTTVQGTEIEDLQVEGASLRNRPRGEQQILDQELGVWWFSLAEPMLPGERRTMGYTLRDDNRGFDVAPSFTDRDIATNGTYLMEELFAPRIGYRESLEIESNFERRRRGLPETTDAPGDDEHASGLTARGDDGYDWITFEATISTEPDQIAIAPGRLVREWRRGERRFFHYRSSGPMARAVAYLSARYAVETIHHRGVEIAVYHHPAHAANVPHMLDVARWTLDHCEDRFGPYGQDHLRLVEIPATWPFGGFAMAGTISLPAHRSFLVDVRDPDAFDLVAKRIAHEVAHQWWGHRVHPVTAPGGTLLVEPMAKYVEWAALDALHGRRQTQTLLEHEHRRYQKGRARDPEPEVPLAQVESRAYLDYGKGYLAMNALRQALGAEGLDRILHRFATTWAHPHPAPRAEDLLRAIERNSSPRVRQVVDDWFRRIVEWDLEVLSAATAPLGDGTWETRLVLSARKLVTDAEGETTEVPIADRLQVGLFATEDVLDPDAAIYLQEHRFDRPTTTLTLRTDRRPAVAGLDPFTVRIDADRLDNLVPVDGVDQKAVRLNRTGEEQRRLRSAGFQDRSRARPRTGVRMSHSPRERGDEASGGIP